MMRLSTRGRYGLRVMTELAVRHGQGPVAADVIAQTQDISAKYIHVLVMGLRSADLVRTVRGPGGGYELAKDPRLVTALDVVQALEGRVPPADCVDDRGTCNRAAACPARDVWCDVAAAVEAILGGVTLATLAEKQRQQNEFIPDYAI